MERYKYPVVVVGNESVGKTSIVMRFCRNVFKERYLPTLCSDFYRKRWVVDEKSIEFQIWDIGGQDQYKMDKETYLKRAYVVIVVFAVDDPVSFMDVGRWVDDAKRIGNNPFIIMVANKIDLRGEEDGCVDLDQFHAEITRLRANGGIESSAKTGTNVAELFDMVARACDGKDSFSLPSFFEATRA